MFFNMLLKTLWILHVQKYVCLLDFELGIISANGLNLMELVHRQQTCWCMPAQRNFHAEKKRGSGCFGGLFFSIFILALEQARAGNHTNLEMQNRSETTIHPQTIKTLASWDNPSILFFSLWQETVDWTNPMGPMRNKSLPAGRRLQLGRHGLLVQNWIHNELRTKHPKCAKQSNQVQCFYFCLTSDNFQDLKAASIALHTVIPQPELLGCFRRQWKPWTACHEDTD